MSAAPRGTQPRYDGHAAWYADWVAGSASRWRSPLLSLAGRGTGACLDLGCGSGEYAEVLQSTGRRVVGMDISADQLRFARHRFGPVVQGDAQGLPFVSGVFEVVTAMWISTDVDDFAAVVREAARVLCVGGVLVVFGVHPCFNGPGVERREDGTQVVHPAYRAAAWHAESPWWSGDGVRDRVGMRHVPLAVLLNAVLDAGLRLHRVLEPGDQDSVPMVLALAAHKTTNAVR